MIYDILRTGGDEWTKNKYIDKLDNNQKQSFRPREVFAPLNSARNSGLVTIFWIILTYCG